VYGLNNEERRGKWAEFRFAVIAPLVCRRLDEAEWQELRREVLSQVYVTPDGDERRFSERTIREWIARYRLHGLPGLRRMVRKDRGVLKALSVEVAGEAYRLREELRTRSISGILAHLRVKSIDADKISKTTLNRYLNNVGLEREKIKAEKGTFQRWQKEHANDLCQADTSGGVWIPDPRNPKVLKQTRLVSFIDDATRVCTHAEFYWNEQQTPAFLTVFGKRCSSAASPGACCATMHSSITPERSNRHVHGSVLSFPFARNIFPKEKGRSKSTTVLSSRASMKKPNMPGSAVWRS